MEKYVIHGGKQLHGEVAISGAKNAAVAIIPAALMVDGVCRIENIPQISDTDMLLTIYRIPTPNDTAVLLSVEDIVNELNTVYPDCLTLKDANMSVGKALKAAGFEQIRTSDTRKYRVTR